MPTQLQTMQAADQALQAIGTCEPLAEHYDPDTGEYRRQTHGIVQNLIGEVIEISYHDQKTPQAARTHTVHLLRDMVAELQAVADALEHTS